MPSQVYGPAIKLVIVRSKESTEEMNVFKSVEFSCRDLTARVEDKVLFRIIRFALPQSHELLTKEVDARAASSELTDTVSRGLECFVAKKHGKSTYFEVQSLLNTHQFM